MLSVEACRCKQMDLCEKARRERDLVSEFSSTPSQFTITDEDVTVGVNHCASQNDDTKKESLLSAMQLRDSLHLGMSQLSSAANEMQRQLDELEASVTRLKCSSRRRGNSFDADMFTPNQPSGKDWYASSALLRGNAAKGSVSDEDVDEEIAKLSSDEELVTPLGQLNFDPYRDEHRSLAPANRSRRSTTIASITPVSKFGRGSKSRSALGVTFRQRSHSISGTPTLERTYEDLFHCGYTYSPLPPEIFIGKDSQRLDNIHDC